MRKSEAISAFKEVVDNYMSSTYGAPDTEEIAKQLVAKAEEIGLEPQPHLEWYGTGHADEYGNEAVDTRWVQGWEAE